MADSICSLVSGARRRFEEKSCWFLPVFFFFFFRYFCFVSVFMVAGVRKSKGGLFADVEVVSRKENFHFSFSFFLNVRNDEILIWIDIDNQMII